MALRSSVSSLRSNPAEGEMPAAPAPRLGRRPGLAAPGSAAQVAHSEPVEEAPEQPAAPQPPAPVEAKPKATRKPRTPKPATAGPVASFVSADVKATRALLGQVEGDIVDLRAQMQKALARFQPKLERLQARHAELSSALVKQLAQ